MYYMYDTYNTYYIYHWLFYVFNKCLGRNKDRCILFLVDKSI